jgi:hypothetical protein
MNANPGDIMREHLEKLLASIVLPETGTVALDRGQLQKLVGDGVDFDQLGFLEALAALQVEGIIRVHGAPWVRIEVIDRRRVGPQRLIRNFCARHYGQVSPLIDRKFTQAILHRHGAAHDLDSAAVQAELKRLADEGLIKIVGREDAYIKMLGAE